MQAGPQLVLGRTWRGTAVIRSLVFFGIAGVLAAVWSPLAPTRLFDFDAANFALALDYFQPRFHQPQPPGYPLYVALTKIIRWFVDDVPDTFLIAGVLGAAAAILMLWLLCERLFGRTAAIFAALLLATNPILWQTGMSDQVRIYIAVISIGVALAVWPVWQRSGDAPRRLIGASLLLGILAGFRPEMGASMVPLLLFAGVHGRVNLRHYGWSALALGAGMAPWLMVLVWRVGGAHAFIAMMRLYSSEQASGSSLLFGAGSAAAWKMLSTAFWWASLGVIAWMPAALLVRWWQRHEDPHGARYFLLVWFAPLFLFSMVVHIAASGHSLGFIPILCAAGGWVLAAVRNTGGRWLMVSCAIVALTLNVALFFKPYSRQVREASYHTVESVNTINETTLAKIEMITQQNSAVLVTDNNAWVSWRILAYYNPKSPVIYLPGPWATPKKSPPVWLIRDRVRVQNLDPNADVALPSCSTIVWLVSDERSKRSVLAVKDAEDERYFIATPAQQGMEFRIGRFRLVTSRQPCSPGASSGGSSSSSIR